MIFRLFMINITLAIIHEWFHDLIIGWFRWSVISPPFLKPVFVNQSNVKHLQGGFEPSVFSFSF